MWSPARMFAGKMGSTPFDYTGMLVLQLKDGKIVDLYEISDELAVGKILGEITNDQAERELMSGRIRRLSPRCGAGDPAQNKQIVQQWWEGDAAAQQALAAPDFAYHNPWSGAAHTYADRAQLMAQIQAAFPDSKFEDWPAPSSPRTTRWASASCCQASGLSCPGQPSTASSTARLQKSGYSGPTPPSIRP